MPIRCGLKRPLTCSVVCDIGMLGHGGVALYQFALFGASGRARCLLGAVHSRLACSVLEPWSVPGVAVRMLLSIDLMPGF